MIPLFLPAFDKDTLLPEGHSYRGEEWLLCALIRGAVNDMMDCIRLKVPPKEKIRRRQKRLREDDKEWYSKKKRLEEMMVVRKRADKAASWVAEDELPLGVIIPLSGAQKKKMTLAFTFNEVCERLDAKPDIVRDTIRMFLRRYREELN